MSTENKNQIKITDVLNLLEEGKDRAAIKEHLGLTHSEMAALFQHPKLKNKKPKTQLSFVLVDDTEEAVEESAPSAVSEEVVNVSGEPESLESATAEADTATETKAGWE